MTATNDDIMMALNDITVLLERIAKSVEQMNRGDNHKHIYQTSPMTGLTSMTCSICGHRRQP